MIGILFALLCGVFMLVFADMNRDLEHRWVLFAYGGFLIVFVVMSALVLASSK